MGIASRPFLFSITLLFFLACSGDSPSDSPQVESDFESASIGRIDIISGTEIDLYLKDDNNDSTLPSSWRNWWFIRISEVNTSRPLKIRIRNRGWNNYYLPVVSYDGKNWERLAEEDVTLSEECALGFNDCSLVIHSQFRESQVYLARYYPYTTKDLEQWLKRISKSRFVSTETIGHSAQLQYPISLLTIEDPETADFPKASIFIHARSHPAETGGSFLVEGFVETLIRLFEEEPERMQFIRAYIVPMHNPDGVIVGNYRTTVESINLENSWNFSSNDVENLIPDAPVENQILQNAMRHAFLSRDKEKALIALNLHSANTDRDTPSFAFPHFGSSEYFTPEEQKLWNSQIALIALVNQLYPVPFGVAGEAGREFLDFFFPETWWWEFAGSEVLAMTVETSYAKAGFSEWPGESEVRLLGTAFARAVVLFLREDSLDSIQRNTIQSRDGLPTVPHLPYLEQLLKQ